MYLNNQQKWSPTNMDIYMFTYRHRSQISRNNCQNIHTTWLCISELARWEALRWHTSMDPTRLHFRRVPGDIDRGQRLIVTTTRNSTQREISNRSLRQHWLRL